MEINLFTVIWGVGLFMVLRTAWDTYFIPKTHMIDVEKLDEMGLLITDVKLGEGFSPDGMRAIPN